MPLYRHNVTGNEFTASEDYVSALAEGAATKLADESPQEEHERLQREALENKVELVFDGDPDSVDADPDNPAVDANGAAVDSDPAPAPAKPARATAKSAEK